MSFIHFGVDITYGLSSIMNVKAVMWFWPCGFTGYCNFWDHHVTHTVPRSIFPRGAAVTWWMCHKWLFVLSEFDSFSPITFGKSRNNHLIKLFYPIYVCEEPPGSQPARPDKDSNEHVLWAQKRRCVRKPMVAFLAYVPNLYEPSI